MTRRVRLRDVADAAATSTKTASRVINGDSRVGADTRARVEHAVRVLDYRPDPLARSLRRGTDETIGVVVDEVGDPFFASVIGEIERMALDRGITVIIASTRRLADRERIVIDGLLQRRVAGLIIASVAADHAHLRSSPSPVVFIDRVAAGLDADAVVVDDEAGAGLAVEHLIVHGHRRIAYVGDRLGIATAVHRWTATGRPWQLPALRSGTSTSYPWSRRSPTSDPSRTACSPCRTRRQRSSARTPGARCGCSRCCTGWDARTSHSSPSGTSPPPRH